MESIAQFFGFLNDINFKYVVLRNWDGLPHSVQTGSHGDLDILVYDIDHFHEVFKDKAVPIYAPPRVQHKVYIKNTYVLTDVRHLGDSYYPYDFENAILNNRVWNSNGFFTPDPTHHRIALAYHAVHHKGFIDPSYKRWLGDTTIEALADALKQSTIGWDKPDDHTVGSYNSYSKGATSVVSSGKNSVTKKQYRFKNFNLIENERRILQGVESKHFPKVINSTEDEIEIEDCGQTLSMEILPKDWEKQLIDSLKDLKKNNIIHRDIRIENIMVKDGTIKLIDFGWAIKQGESTNGCPDLLGHPNKAPWGFDDAFSMGKVIKQIKGRME